MEIVPFLLAKKLKEKGFKEKCYAYYFPTNNELCYNINQFRGGILYDNLYSYNSLPKEVVTSDFIDAPTISQVLKWLREECGVFILVEPDILSPEYKLTFTLRVKFYIKGEEDEGFSEKYLTYRRDSYELAALAGIEYVIDNLI